MSNAECRMAKAALIGHLAFDTWHSGRVFQRPARHAHPFGFERTGTNSSRVATVAILTFAAPAKAVVSSPVGVHGFVFIVATDEPYAKMRYFAPALNTKSQLVIGAVG